MIGALIFLCVVIAIVVWSASLLRLEANRMLAEIARLREWNEKLEADVGECVWKEDYDGNWETSCNETFIIMEGSPEENSMRYCTYCGKKLVPVHYAQEEGDK